MSPGQITTGLSVEGAWLTGGQGLKPQCLLLKSCGASWFSTTRPQGEPVCLGGRVALQESSLQEYRPLSLQGGAEVPSLQV